MEKKIVVAGKGGQGILLAGKLLALAAIAEHKEVTWFPAYGAEMRCGTAHCTVIVSDQFIGAPLSKSCDCLLAMSEPADVRFASHVVPGGLILYETALVKKTPLENGVKTYGIPALRIAADAGDQRAANMVMVGALIGMTGIFSLMSLLASIESVFAGRSALIDKNKRLLEKGYSAYAHQKSLHG
ncbi:MAG TPA: 2-oxoacid:acceptor oxidoreductase family protein [Dissulfurispiraceae bacterium]|nr:2-oxoacid:acceptor oxidoreductase family protein [Dissulfurispiraceae bacterium]